MGLAKQVHNHVMVKKIKKLTKTFVTLSLEDIAKRTGLENASVAENFIVDQVGGRWVRMVMCDDTDLWMDIRTLGGTWVNSCTSR